MRLVYSFSVFAYLSAIYFASSFNLKARQWRIGRRGWRTALGNLAKNAGDSKRIWIHCASLGEFEQGRPIIEGIKKAHPEIFILLTFFSPSGFEIRKNYAYADAVAYLPGDTPRNARDFLGIFKPDLAIFVKYEFWFNLLAEMRRQSIPALLVSARFRSDQIFFKYYGSWFRQQLRVFSKIFLQEPLPPALQGKLGVDAEVAGDTRVDRVMQIREENRAFPEIADFCSGHNVLIAGSTWPADEALIARLVTQPCFQGWKLIIAPHDVGPKRIDSLEANIPLTACRHSALLKGDISPAGMLVIDHVGILSAIYRYGDLAYIGGAFGSGLHNTLEPIAFHLPVLFGPVYHKFPEATQLISSGGAVSVKDAGELVSAFTLLSAEQNYEKAAGAADQYIAQHSGATAVILKEIQKKLLI
ncbi:MAG: hypothetical protein RL386_1596 [Bacteroidota bacterium]